MRRSLALTSVALLLAAGPAHAAWPVSALGTGTVRATALDRAPAPSLLSTPDGVRVEWEAVTTVSGAPATGYEVVRHTGSSTTTVCQVPTEVQTCQDTSPVAGPAAYGVVARLARWRGPLGPLTTMTFDATAPATTMSVSPPPNPAGWSRTGVTVTLTAEDDRSGVDRLAYVVDEGPQMTVQGSSATFPVTGAGEHSVRYSAVDRLGNAETAVTTPVWIDPTAPVSTLTTDASLNAAGWSTRPVDVGLTATDTSGSGVRSLTRQVEGGSPVTAAGAIASVTLAEEGTNTLVYAATDNADNVEGTKTYSVKVDTIAPVTAVTSDPAPTGEGWYRNPSVVLTLSPADATSGVSSLRWRAGTSGPWTAASSWPLTVPSAVHSDATGAATVQFQAADAAGNLEEVQSHTVRIDRDPPAAPTDLALSADTGTSATDAITATEVQSLRGSAEAGTTVEVQVDGTLAGSATVDSTGSFTVPMGTLQPGTHAVTATSVDAAGNRSTAGSLPVSIDQAAPTAAIAWPGASTYSSATLRAGCGTTAVHDVCGTAADPATVFSSGVATVHVEIRRGTRCLTPLGTLTTTGCATRLTAVGATSWSYTTLILGAGSFRLTVWATDHAGNTGQVSTEFVRSRG